MKAIRIHSYGGPEVLKYEDAPLPQPKKEEVLVRVHAAGINPLDWKIREGYLKQLLNHSLPVILGWDFAGIIESIGPGVMSLKKKDEVFGRADVLRNGAYAEYLVVKESDINFKPASIDFITAASFPFAALTAWQSIYEAAELKAGQKILIHAAAGGVGSFAVQFAKLSGAFVIGTASKRNEDFVRNLGADEFIDYTEKKFEDAVKDVDVVFDTLGGKIIERSWNVIKKGGILVSIAGSPSDEEAASYGVRTATVRTRRDATQLDEIAKHIASGKIKSYVENVYPLSETKLAHELSQSGHARGKIVLKIV